MDVKDIAVQLYRAHLWRNKHHESMPVWIKDVMEEARVALGLPEPDLSDEVQSERSAPP